MSWIDNYEPKEVYKKGAYTLKIFDGWSSIDVELLDGGSGSMAGNSEQIHRMWRSIRNPLDKPKYLNLIDHKGRCVSAIWDSYQKNKLGLLVPSTGLLKK